MTVPEEALKDPRNNKSLLGDYEGETKKIKADIDGNLSMGIPDVSTISGGQKRLNISDQDSQQLLTDVLKEMKKMNLHLSLLTDTHLTNTEVG